MENILRWVSDLKRHPLYPSDKVRAVEFIQPVWQDEKLRVGYCSEAVLAKTVIPAPSVPSRGVDLWQSTCFELFVRRANCDSYLEFNFSPSGNWAAYQFASYRNHRSDLFEITAPVIAFESHPFDPGYTVEGSGLMHLDVVIDIPDDWAGAHMDLGLSAVIEETDGTKSYWALAHPPGMPDFHHKDCFALHLEAPSAA